jgi:hypothetical protein
MDFLASKQLRTASGKRRWAPAPNRPEYSLIYYAKLSCLFFLLGAVTELGMIGSGNSVICLFICIFNDLGYYKINLDSVEAIDKALHKHHEGNVFRYGAQLHRLLFADEIREELQKASNKRYEEMQKQKIE